MKFWEPLQPGDRVDIVAPGWACPYENLEKAALEIIQWGLEPLIPKNIFSRHSRFSNSDEVRASLLLKALMNKDSQAVWCVRGGYGSIRLLPYLDKIKNIPPRKLFIGLSDITTLHLFLNQKWGWATLHAPILERIGRKLTDEETRDVIFGLKREVIINQLQPLNDWAKKNCELKAPLIGGNLTVLQSSLATPWQLSSQGKILFFEDVGERGYRIDRILTQFDQAGLLHQAKAIIFGQFIGGEEIDGSFIWKSVKKEFAERLKIPVLRGLSAGHGLKQRPLPFGPASILKLGPKRAQLMIPTGC